jgi:hypothetical protein
MLLPLLMSVIISSRKVLCVWINIKFVGHTLPQSLSQSECFVIDDLQTFPAQYVGNLS